MSTPSSNVAGWFTRLEPADSGGLRPPARPDDPRLGEIVEFWDGNLDALRPGRPVLIGFPQDEGVRRNGGRIGAAQAPDEIRKWLYRLTPGDPASDRDLCDTPPLDVGNVKLTADLEASQEALAEVVARVLTRRGVPIVLGGGHEAALGVFLGYVQTGESVGIVNIDAHLDVRPLIDGKGHSGSPFRQMMEHETPLAGCACLGAQPHATSREHVRFVEQHGGVIRRCEELRQSLANHFASEGHRLASLGCAVHLSIDADVVSMADVPGVSAPNPVGLAGSEVIGAARLAGASREIAGLDLVEISPPHDRDGQSARWGAVLIWNFLIGLLDRRSA